MNTNDSKNLCYAGGIALNCIANTRALNRSEFENLHVPPFPNDAGLAAGMALYGWYHILGNKKSNDFFSPYNGPVYSDEDYVAALQTVKGKCDFRKYENESEVADILEQNNIICVARGRSESGPRALGHRSIICRTDIPNVRETLNEKIKLREWYRPYAPIILDEYAADVLEDHIPYSPYMTTSAVIKEDWRERMAGVCHVDNTTRPQIIKREHCPMTYDMIKNLYDRTGIPAVLNTSFNKREPIVETPQNAIDTFLRFDGIDYMVFDKWIVSKKSS
jgi:carbamoyltransferase